MTSIVQPLIGEAPGGAHDDRNMSPSPSDMNAANALVAAAEATAVLAEKELSASLHHDTDATMDAALDDEGLDTFTPRRGHTVKREDEPIKNVEGKMTCRFTSTCGGLTFDRRCEWR
jgi:hypothetical protein